MKVIKDARPIVFWPPFVLMLLMVVYNFYDTDQFLVRMSAINQWILNHFDWLFSYVTLALVVSLVVVFFSPMGRIRIGGDQAQPLLNKWQWFSITLCTTVATGILFWAAAEPIYHLHSPPESLNIVANSQHAQQFSMATLFMHWSFSPYAIYTVPALVFSLCYYNLDYRFSIGSLLRPVLGEGVYSRGAPYIDSIALFALVAGMSGSLGTGILITSGFIPRRLRRKIIG
jgi:choline-glycine betaine transporter